MNLQRQPNAKKPIQKLIQDIERMRVTFDTEALCENNFGQGDPPKPKRAPVWYFHPDANRMIRLGVPLLWRN